jgi:hypothetical protein
MTLNRKRLEKSFRILQNSVDQEGKPWRIVRVPLPYTTVREVPPSDGISLCSLPFFVLLFSFSCFSFLVFFSPSSFYFLTPRFFRTSSIPPKVEIQRRHNNRQLQTIEYPTTPFLSQLRTLQRISSSSSIQPSNRQNSIRGTYISSLAHSSHPLLPQLPQIALSPTHSPLHFLLLSILHLYGSPSHSPLHLPFSHPHVTSSRLLPTRSSRRNSKVGR